ncbi:MAG: hypothetical protein HY905_05915 [Deltaproteobacteria bacterium]|nr:hypothetical protein [Deltaproteobacteria bacterium]
MARWMSIVLRLVLPVLCAGGCAEDRTPAAPETDVDRHGLLWDLTDDAYDDLPVDELAAAEAAVTACQQPLGGTDQRVQANQIRAFYKHPVRAVLPADFMPPCPSQGCGGELYAPGFFDVADDDACGWNRSAMLAHAILKCVATHLHQAAVDSSRELPFDSRMRLIGRARFA